MQKHTLNDREMLTDALSSEKFMTENYNQYANECASPCLLYTSASDSSSFSASVKAD